MPAVTCPDCASEDILGKGRTDAGDLLLKCDACGREWVRTPNRPCPRCGSLDVEQGAYEGWAYDSLDEARETGFKDATWEYVDRLVFRCRKCHNQWSAVAGSRRPPSEGGRDG